MGNKQTAQDQFGNESDDEMISKSAVPHYINVVNGNWSEYKRLFHSIDWNDNIPNSFLKVKQTNSKLFDLVMKIEKETNGRPATIRTRETLLDIMKNDTAFYNKYNQYIQHNLYKATRGQSIESVPSDISSKSDDTVDNYRTDTEILQKKIKSTSPSNFSLTKEQTIPYVQEKPTGCRCVIQ